MRIVYHESAIFVRTKYTTLHRKLLTFNRMTPYETLAVVNAASPRVKFVSSVDLNESGLGTLAPGSSASSR